MQTIDKIFHVLHALYPLGIRSIVELKMLLITAAQHENKLPGLRTYQIAKIMQIGTDEAARVRTVLSVRGFIERNTRGIRKPIILTEDGERLCSEIIKLLK